MHLVCGPKKDVCMCTYLYIYIYLFFFQRERERYLAVSQFISTIHKFCFNLNGFHSWIYFYGLEKKSPQNGSLHGICFFCSLENSPIFFGIPWNGPNPDRRSWPGSTSGSGASPSPEVGEKKRCPRIMGSKPKQGLF